MVKITLFGKGGTGKSTLANLFAKRNNFAFMSSGNMFRDMGKEMSMSVYEFNEYCEKNPDIDKILDKKIEEYGREKDNFIFESRLAWFFIPDSFKIKIVCDFDERIKRIAQRDVDEIDIVKTKTKERELSEKLRYKKLYDIDDYEDESHFDLIINSTNLTPEELCEEIEEKILNFN